MAAALATLVAPVTSQIKNSASFLSAHQLTEFGPRRLVGQSPQHLKQQGIHRSVLS
jgi:hypothetical protein